MTLHYDIAIYKNVGPPLQISWDTCGLWAIGWAYLKIILEEAYGIYANTTQCYTEGLSTCASWSLQAFRNQSLEREGLMLYRCML